jgi:hypothetical protein
MWRPPMLHRLHWKERPGVIAADMIVPHSNYNHVESVSSGLQCSRRQAESGENTLIDSIARNSANQVVRGRFVRCTGEYHGCEKHAACLKDNLPLIEPTQLDTMVLAKDHPLGC